MHRLEPVARFDNARCVAAYCGLDPREQSSGEITRFGSISKQGNRLLRTLLIEAAHAAVWRRSGDDQLRCLYGRLAWKKHSGVASVAVARKLVVRLYTMLRDKIDYDEFRRRGRDARCAPTRP